MGLADVVSLVAQSGLAVALVVFLTWQGWERERKADDREKAMHDHFNSRVLARLDEAIGRQRELIENQHVLMTEAARTREAIDRISQGQPPRPD